MKTIRVLTWNLHFISNIWPIRHKKIQKCLSTFKKPDILAFQEVGIAGTESWSHCYQWGKKNSYDSHYIPFMRRPSFLKKNFFPWILNACYFLNCIIFVFCGEIMYYLFDIYFFRIFILPFFALITFPILVFLKTPCRFTF